MEFIEETLTFVETLKLEESPLRPSFNVAALSTMNRMAGPVLVAGITVRLGSQPIVRNLREILELSHASIPPDIQVLFKKKDIFSVAHAVGVLRVKGKAVVDELQYHAKVIDIDKAQTIDLIPSTRFKEALSASVTIEGAMLAAGNVSAEVPNELLNALLPKYLSLGGDMQIQLSSNASFIGKFNLSVKYPVVQSVGIASNSCSWVLSPDEKKTPLLGDQVLVQIIAVPKGVDGLTYSAYGVVKVDRGLLYSQEQKRTQEYQIAVKL